MKLLNDLFSTDYGLMSIVVIAITLCMAAFFLRLFLVKMKEPPKPEGPPSLEIDSISPKVGFERENFQYPDGRQSSRRHSRKTRRSSKARKCSCSWIARRSRNGFRPI